MDRKYAVLILSHGRAERVYTIKALRRQGYTGEIYIVVDNEDEQVEEYKRIYGNENVIVFDKAKAANDVDVADQKKERNVVVFARNQCHRIAKSLGLTHFIEADDDYSIFSHKSVINGANKQFKIKNLDAIFDAMFDFLDTCGAYAIAPGQGGDYIGGMSANFYKKGLVRKCMNLFFCRTDKPFKFYGRLNEDTTAYTYLGQKGALFFTVTQWMLNQKMTQTNKGGLTDAYLDVGTYVKSFYSVMFSPSCVKISVLGDSSKKERHDRIHHRVEWGYCTPMILSERYRK